MPQEPLLPLPPDTALDTPSAPQQSDVVAASLDILAELTARYGSLLPDPEGLKKVGGWVESFGWDGADLQAPALGSPAWQVLLQSGAGAAWLCQ